MIRIKHVAVLLALVGSIGSAQAGSKDVSKNKIQFLEDKTLAETKGAVRLKNKNFQSPCAGPTKGVHCALYIASY